MHRSQPKDCGEADRLFSCQSVLIRQHYRGRGLSLAFGIVRYFSRADPSPRGLPLESHAFHKSRSPKWPLPTCRSEPDPLPFHASFPAVTLQSPAFEHERVADESHILDALNAPDPRQTTFLFEAPKLHTRLDFVPQFLSRHVGTRPAIPRNNATVGLRAIVNDGPCDSQSRWSQRRTIVTVPLGRSLCRTLD